MKLNVIIPSYNEEGNVELLHEKLTETLKDIKYELVFINDGSKDKTIEKLKQVFEKDKKHVRIINFSRNFGKDAAMYAGLKHSNAEYTVIIDADLQQNPNYLLDMMNFLDKHLEYDQVAMINNKRKTENAFIRFLKGNFYKIINMLSDTSFVKGASDFRMFRKNVVTAICALAENNRFSKGIFAWVGFNTKYMEYSHNERHSGKTKFGFKKSFQYAFDGIVNFSVKPLRIATFSGFCCAGFAFVYFSYIFIRTLIMGSDVPGFPSLICLILFLGGLQLMATGILGEYIAKMYIQTKSRPIYISREELGFEEDIL